MKDRKVPFARAPYAEPPSRYAASLDDAITAMETGNHPKAVAPLATALAISRNETTGLITLGVLALHVGDSRRALREFRRVQSLAEADTIAGWGDALASLSLRQPVVPPAMPPGDTFPVAPFLTDYARLLNGEAPAVRAVTADVTDEEPDLLRLSVAGFAALNAGDSRRGGTLLNALLDRPSMRPLAEERAPLLTFLPDLPLQGGATAALAPLTLPEPGAGPPLSGMAVLLPPNPLPRGASFVAYAVSGLGGVTASTNNPPYTTEWNTERVPNGLYTVRSTVFDDNGTVLTVQDRTFVVRNANAPSASLLTDDEQKQLRNRLTRLLIPRPARKAAHFALAELAARVGDSEGALRHIETVVAIDPLYRNARASLRNYNQTVVGKRDGIWCGVTQEKIVALTFDDGPTRARTPVMLDLLKKEGVIGTFFVVGARVEEFPDVTARIAAEKHEIANHSYSHQNLTFMDPYNVERELCRTSVLIRQVTGKRPRFFRPPGGNNNTAVVRAAESLGMAGAYWTLDGIKWEYPPYKPEGLARYILDNVRPGAIILLHNAPENTVAALPMIIRGLRARGYQMVTMSELVRRAKAGGIKDLKAKPSGIKE